MKVNKGRRRSTLAIRGGYQGSPIKSLPKITSPAATAKGKSNSKGSAKTKS